VACELPDLPVAEGWIQGVARAAGYCVVFGSESRWFTFSLELFFRCHSYGAVAARVSRIFPETHPAVVAIAQARGTSKPACPRFNPF
jgi:hypothetical protein